MEKERDLSQGMRLNKYLSDAGVCSRRQADRLVAEGRVVINGHKAIVGQKVMAEDTVLVDNKKVDADNELIVIALNKPEGIECTTDKDNPDNIVDYVGIKKRIYPVGRLDKNSCGLIFLTNDGELANEIMRAANYHEKEYVVTTDKKITEDFIKKMSLGVLISQFDRNKNEFKVKTRRCTVKKCGDRSFSIILTQGFNRQIRRMCTELGFVVVKLKRVRIMDINLGDIMTGKYRYLMESEINSLRNQIGIKKS